MYTQDSNLGIVASQRGFGGRGAFPRVSDFEQLVHSGNANTGHVDGIEERCNLIPQNSVDSS
jgi:hypothetical protein